MSRVAWQRRPEVLPVTGRETLTRKAAETAEPSILTRWPVLRDIAGRIGVPELQRRLTHMSPGLLPFLLWIIPHQDPWGPFLMNSVVGISIALTAVILYRFHMMARSQRETGLSAVIGYVIPVVSSLVLLPGRAEIGMMTLAIIAVGDGSATLGGLWFGGTKLPWNSRKTFTGLMCFCLCGTMLGTLVYWGEARPEVSWTMALLCAAGATLAAAVVESLPLPTNDNFRVGMTAALTAACIQFYGFGG